MEQKQVKNQATLRERLIFEYVEAMDEGDLNRISIVLDAALDDPELDRIIAEINQDYWEEEGLDQFSEDAQVINTLLQQHLPSAFQDHTIEDHQITVGQVAARLKSDREIPIGDETINQSLIDSAVPIPDKLSKKEIRRLWEQIGVKVSERFLKAFRSTAIKLSMGQSHSQAQFAAARESRDSRKSSSSKKVDNRDVNSLDNKGDKHGSE